MSSFSEQLITWYHDNKRDLPWRNTIDPYKIWLSEVILQQTRVQQGLPYFEKFVINYPTVTELARTEEMEVLKLWQGLGYYSRARNLLKTARYIQDKLEGKFPNNYSTLITLPGVGPYTAAAIASFSRNEKIAVVDGNVYRVLARIFGLDTPIDSTAGKKEFAQLATELISERAADHNQAIMEFGAMVCKPKQPGCDGCIFHETCVARLSGTHNELPVKAKKTAVKTRHFNYLVFNRNENTYLKQRKEGDIWQGLYDFPLIETTSQIEHPDQIISSKEFVEWQTNAPVFMERSSTYRHLLSHREILATFWEFHLPRSDGSNNELVSIKRNEQTEYPLPQLIDNYLKNNKKHH